ncbi:hypothetical protein BJ508DRAFT_327853 [Ascobolus immersus RN42]|uniref:Uncharacterized protein n=1 Tax=Ascobolus immersus RN42 TaxID=1160509 RepID=A0A3N4I7D4_ASCIM|nr:hypothetical protein BJ508DRAFT_327853 [Ascobolus immersus RN42]
MASDSVAPNPSQQLADLQARYDDLQTRYDDLHTANSTLTTAHTTLLTTHNKLVITHNKLIDFHDLAIKRYDELADKHNWLLFEWTRLLDVEKTLRRSLADLSLTHKTVTNQLANLKTAYNTMWGRYEVLKKIMAEGIGGRAAIRAGIEGAVKAVLDDERSDSRYQLSAADYAEFLRSSQLDSALKLAGLEWTIANEIFGNGLYKEFGESFREILNIGIHGFDIQNPDHMREFALAAGYEKKNSEEMIQLMKRICAKNPLWLETRVPHSPVRLKKTVVQTKDKDGAVKGVGEAVGVVSGVGAGGKDGKPGDVGVVKKEGEPVGAVSGVGAGGKDGKPGDAGAVKKEGQPGDHVGGVKKEGTDDISGVKGGHGGSGSGRVGDRFV